MYLKASKYQMEKEERIVGEFERNQTSLRLKPLVLEKEPEVENDVLACKAYMKDAMLYKKETKKRFDDIKSKFRDIMDNIRNDHFDDFHKVGEEKRN